MEEYVFRAIVIGIVNFAVLLVAGLLEQRSECFRKMELELRKEIRKFEAICMERRLNKHEEKKAKYARQRLRFVSCQGSKATSQAVLAFICGSVTQAIFLVLMLVFLRDVPNHIAITLLATGVTLGTNRIAARKLDLNATFFLALIAIFAIFFYKIEK